MAAARDIADDLLFQVTRLLRMRGRETRTGLALILLAAAPVQLLLTLLTSLLAQVPRSGAAGVLALGLDCLLFGVSGVIAVMIFCAFVRRMHDQGVDGWAMAVAIFPIIGPIVLLARLCWPGTDGPNAYGPDPRALRE